MTEQDESSETPPPFDAKAYPRPRTLTSANRTGFIPNDQFAHARICQIRDTVRDEPHGTEPRTCAG
eukprot:6204576-Pleurochrysis_carterae.AAC.1